LSASTAQGLGKHETQRAEEPAHIRGRDEMRHAAQAPGAHDRALLGEGALDIRSDEARAEGADRGGRSIGSLRLNAPNILHDMGDSDGRSVPRWSEPLPSQARLVGLVVGKCESHGMEVKNR
jgi:hypothetical protein